MLDSWNLRHVDAWSAVWRLSYQDKSNIDYYDDFAPAGQDIISDIENYVHNREYNTDAVDSYWLLYATYKVYRQLCILLEKTVLA